MQPSDIAILETLRGKQLRTGPWTWQTSNNTTLQPVTIIFPLIKRWQQKAKAESPSKGVWAQKHCAQGHYKGGGRACDCMQATASALSFHSSSTCLCDTGQERTGHLVLWVSDPYCDMSAWSSLACLGLTILQMLYSSHKSQVPPSFYRRVSSITQVKNNNLRVAVPDTGMLGCSS